MLAHRLRVAQIVMLLEQTVEQAFLRRPPDLLPTQRPQGLQRDLDRATVQVDHAGTRPLDQGIGRRLLPRRQGDVPGAVQRQQQAPADHVPELSVGLDPVPGPAKLLR